MNFHDDCKKIAENHKDCSWRNAILVPRCASCGQRESSFIYMCPDCYGRRDEPKKEARQ